jgi:hypothetical protein
LFRHQDGSIRARGLIMNERLEQYDGTTAVVLTDTNKLWGNSIRPVLGLES